MTIFHRIFFTEKNKRRKFLARPVKRHKTPSGILAVNSISGFIEPDRTAKSKAKARRKHKIKIRKAAKKRFRISKLRTRRFLSFKRLSVGRRIAKLKKVQKIKFDRVLKKFKKPVAKEKFIPYLAPSVWKTMSYKEKEEHKRKRAARNLKASSKAGWANAFPGSVSGSIEYLPIHVWRTFSQGKQRAIRRKRVMKRLARSSSAQRIGYTPEATWRTLSPEQRRKIIESRAINNAASNTRRISYPPNTTWRELSPEQKRKTIENRVTSNAALNTRRIGYGTPRALSWRQELVLASNTRLIGRILYGT